MKQTLSEGQINCFIKNVCQSDHFTAGSSDIYIPAGIYECCYTNLNLIKILVPLNIVLFAVDKFDKCQYQFKLNFMQVF